MNTPASRGLRATLLTCLSLVLLIGCAGPAYYFQAAKGQLGLMHKRQNIDEFLATAPPGDPTAARLNTARDMLDFAQESLGLPANDSYSSFLPMESSALVWNVIATPALSLEPKTWCFPVAGCVPYRGYFEQEKASKFASALAAKGMDTSVSGAAAYSTLGWFKDPIPGAVLRSGDAQLANLLFHELAHQRLYVSGAAQFNEAYATVVARAAVREWFVSRGALDELARVDQQRQAAEGFQALLRETRSDLAGLYASEQSPDDKLAHKRLLLAGLEQRIKAHSADTGVGTAWLTGPINNADLALIDTYNAGVCALQQLLNQAGQNLQQFHELAEKAAQRPDLDRWLAQPCSNAPAAP